MSSSPDARRERLTRRRVVTIAVVAALALLSWRVLSPRDPKPRDVQAPPGTSHITIALTDLYMPFLTPAENADLRSRLPDHVEVVAHYVRTTTRYRLFSCSPGLGCLPEPQWHQQVDDEILRLPAKVTPRAGADAARTISFDLPHRLDGGYSIAWFLVDLSLDALTRQPGYRTLVTKTDTPDYKPLDPIAPSLEYGVSFEDHDLGAAPRYAQDCLDALLPVNVPEIAIPIVTALTTSSPRMSLSVRNMRCPLSDIGSDFHTTAGVRIGAAPGRLPPGRIAAAQVKLDLDGTHGVTRLYGSIRPTPAMTRWYRRNEAGIDASLIEFGPYRRLELRTRFDNAYPVKQTLPIRTETWTFFDDALVGYGADIDYYIDTADRSVLFRMQWEQYFRDGRTVWTQTTTRPCDDVFCDNEVTGNPEAEAISHDVLAASRKALGELQGAMAKPYDALQADARAYLQLRSALKPDDAH
ncbi:hypothetical protein [Burkholderia ubonensis]|uniref:hypothetical protein n=1 Tax=Burkholderia ubonensis TaxID=101571 RepID=UPI0007528956|nr:hypothetical protein [Burkholderia ubonensis]KVC84439.1 hypothetical protein WI74_32975 [Burkholderia ubonensis]